jgi:hypothetical protein
MAVVNVAIEVLFVLFYKKLKLNIYAIHNEIIG